MGGGTEGKGWAPGLKSRLVGGGGAVEVLLDFGPEVVGDVASEFEAFDVVGLDVVSAEDAGDAGEFGDFGEGGELEGDVTGGVFGSDHFGEGFAVELLHFFTGKSLFGDFAGVALLDEAAVVAAGEVLEHAGAGAADGAVARDVSGEGRGDEVCGGVGVPFFAGDVDDAFSGAGPALDGFAAEVVADEGPGAGGVVVALGIPGGDEGVEGGVADGEEEFYVAVEVVFVALGDGLGEAEPVAGLAGGAGAVAHEFDDGFLFGGEGGIEVDAFEDFFEELVVADERWGAGAELIGAFEGEGFDAIPVWGEESGGKGGAVFVGEGDGLPAVGIGDFVGGVDGAIHGVVGVGLAVGAGFVSELVGAVLMALHEDGFGDGVANADGGGGVERLVVGVVAHFFHFAGEVVLEVGELVNGGAVGGVGDGGFLVFEGALAGGAAEFSAVGGADGLVIVGGPGIEHGGAGNGHLAGEDGGHGADAFDVSGGGFEDDVEPLVSGGCLVVAGL